MIQSNFQITQINRHEDFIFLSSILKMDSQSHFSLGFSITMGTRSPPLSDSSSLLTLIPRSSGRSSSITACKVLRLQMKIIPKPYCIVCFKHASPQYDPKTIFINKYLLFNQSLIFTCMKSLFITNPYLFYVSDTHFITFGELTYSLVVFQNLPILCPACGCLVRRNHRHLHYLEHLFLCPHIAHKAETKQVHNLRHIIDSL